MPRNHEGEPQQHHSFKRAAGTTLLAGAAVIGAAERGAVTHPQVFQAAESTPHTLVLQQDTQNASQEINPAFGDKGTFDQHVSVPVTMPRLVDASTSNTEPKLITRHKGALTEAFMPNIDLTQPQPADSATTPHVGFLTQGLQHDIPKGTASYADVTNTNNGSSFEAVLAKKTSKTIKLHGHKTKEDVYLMDIYSGGTAGNLTSEIDNVAWYQSNKTKSGTTYALSPANNKTFAPDTNNYYLKAVIAKDKKHNNTEDITFSMLPLGDGETPIQAKATVHTKKPQPQKVLSEFFHGKLNNLFVPVKTEPPTPTPTIGPSPTPTPVETPTLSPTALPVPQTCTSEQLNWPSESLDQALADWKSGKIHADKSYRLIDPATNLPKPFGYNPNILADSTKFSDAIINGTLLGAKMLNNHVIMFIGFEDVSCNQYFIPFNAGDITNKNNLMGGLLILKDPNLEDINNNTLELLTPDKFLPRIQQLAQEKTTLETFLQISTVGLNDTSAAIHAYIQELKQQIPLANQLSQFMFETTYNKPLTDLQAPSIINQNPNTFNIAEIPLIQAGWVWTPNK